MPGGRYFIRGRSDDDTRGHCDLSLRYIYREPSKLPPVIGVEGGGCQAQPEKSVPGTVLMGEWLSSTLVRVGAAHHDHGRQRTHGQAPHVCERLVGSAVQLLLQRLGALEARSGVRRYRVVVPHQPR